MSDSNSSNNCIVRVTEAVRDLAAAPPTDAVAMQRAFTNLEVVFDDALVAWCVVQGGVWLPAATKLHWQVRLEGTLLRRHQRQRQQYPYANAEEGDGDGIGIGIGIGIGNSDSDTVLEHGPLNTLVVSVCRAAADFLTHAATSCVGNAPRQAVRVLSSIIIGNSSTDLAQHEA
jgi:hypothetical protein